MPFVLLVGLFGAACGGSGAAPSASTTSTVGAAGPLGAGLLTEAQLHHVPGLSTVKVSLADTSVFADPDPRGPCGAKVPVLPLADAAGVTVTAASIRGGAELIVRLAHGAAQRYLDARMADTVKGCPEYQTVTRGGASQRVLLVRVVNLRREFEQALAVVTALKIGTSVRAATQIDVRRGDILARVVIFTNLPMANAAVRSVASLTGRDLAVFAG
jgi:hypothetical protein